MQLINKQLIVFSIDKNRQRRLQPGPLCASLPDDTKKKCRELRITRTLNAPIELVWEVWTKAEHIRRWWGPNGFTNTIRIMDVRPGGEWEFTMHGPDGTDYRNKSIFREIVKPSRIVYEHVSGPKFIATVTFTPDGNKTILEWHMLFETAEEFLRVIKVFKADEGLKQNIVKLEDYLVAYVSRTPLPR